MDAAPTADPILWVATGFMASKYLFVASELGLFAALADGPLSVEALAARLGAPSRTTRIVADALVALGLLERDGERYRNTPATATYLTGGADTGLRPYLRFFDRLNYPNWLQFEAAVRTGTATPPSRTADEQRLFSEGVAAFTARAARALADRYDFGAHRRLLDLGGGTGSFLIEVLGRAPHLATTLFDTPAVADIARRRLAASPVAGRVEVVGGDFLAGAIPTGHDAVLVANVVNTFTPERNRALLRRVRDAAPAGGRLLILGMWTDESRARPHHVAMMAGSFLLAAGEGEAHRVDDVRAWLEGTGWRVAAQDALTEEATLLVADAV